MSERPFEITGDTVNASLITPTPIIPAVVPEKPATEDKPTPTDPKE